jgi:inosine-uridine nucleoside N-ribohydrolase
MTDMITRRQFSGLLAAGTALAGLAPAAAGAAAKAGGGERRKVIFDTDPGIDDAMALLFLHYLPDIDLLGVTTTFGNHVIDVTTRNALYLVEHFKMNVPVAKGVGDPLVGQNGPPPVYVHGQNGLGDVPIPDQVATQPDPRPAHKFIIDTVRSHPGEVTLVAVGRMTNLALALREDPEIAGLVKDVIIMGGAFGYFGNLGNVTPAAEANIHGDPVAADEVFGAKWHMTAVGLDVTHRVEMPQDYLRALSEEAGEVGKFIWDITRFYENFYRQSGMPSIFVHDASAVAYLADPSLFKTRSGAVRVVSEGLAFGQTIQRPDSRKFPAGAWDNRPSQDICIDVEAEKLRQLFRRTIIAGSKTLAAK